MDDASMEVTEDIETILVTIDEIDTKIREREITLGLLLNALHFMEKELGLQ